MLTPSILVVDDDPDACATTAKLLWAWGYQADVAHDGASAHKLADQKKYAIAIIDYMMPGMNGIELFRRMRRLQPDLAAIILTGYTSIDVVYPAIEAGILRVLAKPVDFNELMPIIEQHVGGSVYDPLA
ncbi:MAG TPA: response regulator [Pirellulales bacterium]|nr:response regulator [Pirellulales bacterium]